jgi:hypothetical protein
MTQRMRHNPKNEEAPQTRCPQLFIVSSGMATSRAFLKPALQAHYGP